MAASERDDEVAELYSLPFEEFTPKRDELAKRLRANGEKEDAARVRKLKKPTRSAWAVNQGVRADPAAAERLVEAGRQLEAAQTDALGGKGPAKLKDTMAAQHEAVEEMLTVVRRAAGPDLSPALLDRARETLRALAGDEALQAEFIAARLTKDREAVGFGGLAPATVVRPSKAKRPAAPASGARREAEARVKRADRALDAAAKRVAQMRKGIERAQRTLGEAQRRYADAEGERAEREAELEDARAALGEHTES